MSAVAVERLRQTAAFWSANLVPQWCTAIDETNVRWLLGSGSANVPMARLDEVVTLTTVVGAAFGGTGQSSYTIGDILYASGATALSKLSDVATGNALISGGAATAPAWGKIGLTTHVSGTLAAGNGGTGVATLTGIAKGNGTSAFTAAVAGTDYLAPTGNGGALTGFTSGQVTGALGYTPAHNGPNSDITSLAGLTTALSIAQGGTGAATAAAALTALGAAASGANADITSLGAIPRSTWTPVLSFGGGSTGLTYSVQLGSIVRLGKLRVASFEIALSAVGSSTGAAKIDGLPDAATGISGLVVVNFYSGMASMSAALMCYLTASGTTINLDQMGAAAISALTNANFTNSTNIFGTAIYLVT